MKITYNVQAPDRRGFAKSEEVKAIEDFLTSGNAKNMCFEYDTKDCLLYTSDAADEL